MIIIKLNDFEITVRDWSNVILMCIKIEHIDFLQTFLFHFRKGEEVFECDFSDTPYHFQVNIDHMVSLSYYDTLPLGRLEKSQRLALLERIYQGCH